MAAGHHPWLTHIRISKSEADSPLGRVPETRSPALGRAFHSLAEGAAGVGGGTIIFC